MIYLDYNATTPCDEKVLNEMLPFFKQDYANPSSNHALGWIAKDAIDNTTSMISRLLGIQSDELIYTSGATEAINMVLKSIWHARKDQDHIITAKTEHKAVLDTCAWLENQGARVTYLDVNTNGLVDIEELEKSIDQSTLLVSIMLVNNETGVIQPIEAISQICKTHRVPLFSDATQALGKVTIKNFFDAVDYACFSAHKFYGPKGIGFVYLSNKTDNTFESFIQGGGQQKGLRGGTLNTPLIVGLGHALKLALEDLSESNKHLEELRDYVEQQLLEIEGTTLNGAKAQRIPGTTNISFEFVDGTNLLRALSTKIALSNGSACNSASVEPSHVLTAMGVKRELAFASLRIGLGKYTTKSVVEAAVNIIKNEVAKQRENNIFWERRHL